MNKMKSRLIGSAIALIAMITIVAIVDLIADFSSPNNRSRNAIPAASKPDTLWATAIVEGVQTEFHQITRITVQSLGIDSSQDSQWSGHCPGWFEVVLPIADSLARSVKANIVVQVGFVSDDRPLPAIVGHQRYTCHVEAIRFRPVMNPAVVNALIAKFTARAPERSRALFRSSQ